MVSLDDLRAERIKKINLLREYGMDPYPVETRRDHTLKEVQEQFSALAEHKTHACVVGRIRTFRRQGGVAFVRLDDGTGELQCVFQRDALSEKLFNLAIDVLDVGDFIEACGTAGETKRGERSLFADEWRMLSKSIRPLPDKWHGLVDPEERLRRRYLDLIMSPETRERFVRRSAIISFLRMHLEASGYLEVETPVLQPLYGGASAEPFITHHNTLDTDLFLRISDELYLKRLLVGGFPKVYEISKNFRNEGIDATHYPEFTMLEFYESFADAASQRAFTETMLRELVRHATGGDALTYKENELNFGTPFSVQTYADILREYAGIESVFTVPRDELQKKAEELGIAAGEHDSSDTILDALFKKACRPNIQQPTFIVDYPADMLPLAKRSSSDAEGAADRQKTVDAFQLIVGGIELVKAFSELNDPQEQRARFETQEKRHEKGEGDTQRMDEDFIEALEYGMPPAGGVGIGVDRLVMLLTDTHQLKETILFPTMKPR